MRQNSADSVRNFDLITVALQAREAELRKRELVQRVVPLLHRFRRRQAYKAAGTAYHNNAAAQTLRQQSHQVGLTATARLTSEAATHA